MNYNNEVLERIKTKIAEINAKRDAMIAELRTDFPLLFSEIFAQNEWLESFGWKQYTSYFNDGDETNFSTYIDASYMDINDGNTDDVDWYDWKWNRDEYKDEVSSSTDIEKCKTVHLLEETLNSIPDEFYKDLFGDHVTVTVYRNGSIEIDDYEDHD
jgi:hypothetical protein